MLSNYKSDSTELPDFEYDIFTVSHVQIYVTGIGCIDGNSIIPLSAMKRNKDKIETNSKIQEYILSKLKLDWSPEEIS